MELFGSYFAIILFHENFYHTCSLCSLNIYKYTEENIQLEEGNGDTQ